MTPLEPTSWSQALIGSILALTLGASGLMAWQAFDAASVHRSAAEAVLRDYAAFAGAQFAVRARERLDQAVVATLERVACAPSSAARTRAAMAMVAAQDEGAGCQPPLPATAVAVRVPGASWEAVAGALPPALRPALDALPERPCPKRGHCLLALGSGDETTIAAVWHGTRSRGLETPLTVALIEPRHVTAILHGVVRADDLLPSSLASTATDRWLAVAAIHAGGQPVGPVEALSFPADFVHTVTLGPAYGDLGVDLALDPASASSLVIGGLPSSRVPYILGLLAVTVVLLGVASRQWSHERRLARARGRFIAGASHELRTPIAQIRLFADTLALGRVRSREERDRSLAIIQTEAGRLSHLVDNLLQATRGERMPRALPEDTDLGTFVMEVATAFAPLARQAGMTIAVETPPTFPARVDRAALRRALVNLLDNAVKYGPRGQVISVCLTEVGGRARLRVADEGPGVPPESRETIWRPFSRLDRPIERAIPGTGLGLSIVRDAVAALGGEATVETRAAGGAGFVITLPIDAPLRLAASA